MPPQMGITVDDTALVSAWHELLAPRTRDRFAERRLQHDHGLGVSEYEVLERLAGSADGKSRMQELADAVHLSQSALSRVVARLEADGSCCAACAPRTAAGSSPA